jgi:hypothetical protein
VHNVCKMKVAAVDIQGFYIKSELYPKEMSIRISKKTNHYIFKEPMPFDVLNCGDRKTVSYTEKYHGIKYTSGHIPYDEINNIIIENLSDIDIVYVRGANKATFLHDKTWELPILSYTVIDISKFDDSASLLEPPPKIEATRTPMCLNHSQLPARCTQNTTEDILRWLQNMFTRFQ